MLTGKAHVLNRCNYCRYLISSQSWDLAAAADSLFLPV
jgi:hypothetical protein